MIKTRVLGAQFVRKCTNSQMVRVQVRKYMTTNETIKTASNLSPHYRSLTSSQGTTQLNSNNYIVLYCNPKPKFLKYTCIVSLVYGITLIIASYNFLVTSIEKQKANFDIQTFGFDTNMKIALGLFLTGGLTMIGFAYYARKNVLELGLLKDASGKVTQARVVQGKLFSRSGTSEKFYPATELNSPSLHMLRLDPHVVDSKTTSAADIQKRKRLGDYMFMRVRGSQYNYLMDLTNEQAYLDRSEMERYFRSNLPTNKKVNFNE